MSETPVTSHKLFGAAPTIPEHVRETPTIPEFFRGRNVFVTGGSGFMGKVLLEKLLRSCPDIGSVYVLLRDKKAVEVKDRLGAILGIPLFDRLRSENPSVFTKLVPIAGDVTQLGLGMRSEDRAILQDAVSVVFHTAASIRFDDALKQAVITNVRGTREAIELALGMTKLKVFVHVSTAYSNCDQNIVREEMYPAHGDWKTMIQLAEDEGMDQYLCSLTPKILGYLPNTYSYAKSLAEHLIKDFEGRLPVVIFRPTIVGSAYKEPLPGWVDTFAGPVGLLMAAESGLVRTIHGEPKCVEDYVPVDLSIKALIVAAWQRAVNSSPPSVPIYNCSGLVKCSTVKNMAEMADKVGKVNPFRTAIWYPSPSVTRNETLYFLMVLVLHMLPALVIDGLLMATGRKTFLTRLQKKIYVANMSLARFLIQTITFENRRCMGLNSSLEPEDLRDFRFDDDIPEFYDYVLDGSLGAARYLLHETPEDQVIAKRNHQRFYWLHVITKTTFRLVFVFWAGSYLSYHLAQLTAGLSWPRVLKPLGSDF